MKSLNWINNLKLRASYGEVGNDQSAAYYAYQALYLADTNAHQGAYIKSQLANPELKWEKSSSIDIALEGRLFDRLNFSIDYLTNVPKICYSMFIIRCRLVLRIFGEPLRLILPDVLS